MRSGAAAGHHGFFQETAFYRSDDEFLAVVLPFLHEGVAAGEPTVALFGERNQNLVRAALGRRSRVILIDGDRHYQRPAVAIKRHREMLAAHVARGAVQIRIAGDVPHPGVGVPWEWWARYEAAANNVYNGFPLYGLCPYDTRTAPPEVLDHARRPHSHLVTADGRRNRSTAYQGPQDLLSDPAAVWADPVETQPPAAELLDPDTQACPARDRSVAGNGRPQPRGSEWTGGQRLRGRDQRADARQGPGAAQGVDRTGTHHRHRSRPRTRAR